MDLLPENPYLPMPVGQPLSEPTRRHASVSRRIAARLADGAVLMMPMLGWAALTGAFTDGGAGAEANPLYYGGAVVWMAVVAVWSSVLMSRAGQTPGKRLLGIRVMHGDKPADFGRGILVRELLYGVISTMAGSVATCGLAPTLPGAVVNLAFLLGRENRALHDRLAQTWVEEIGEPTA